MFNFFKKAEDTKKQASAVSVDEKRFTVMPEKIVVTPPPVDVPVERQKEPSRVVPPASIPPAHAAPAPVAPKPAVVDPEAHAVRRLVVITASVLAVAVVVAAGIVWWYEKNPVAMPVPANEVKTEDIVKKPDLGINAEAKDADGRTVGSLKIRIPGISQPEGEYQYFAQAFSLPGAPIGAFNLSPAGAQFLGPVAFAFSYFDTDLQSAGVAETDLAAFEVGEDGVAVPFGTGSLDANANEFSLTASVFPKGTLYLGTLGSKVAVAPKSLVSPFKDIVAKSFEGNAISSSSDIDSDGLTDIEEQSYATDSSKSDTDGDSFADGTEVLNGYSPIDAAPARLVSSASGKKFSFPELGYEVTYPSSFAADPLKDGDLHAAAFSAPQTGEVIELVSAELGGATLVQWYESTGGSMRDFVVGTYRGQPALVARNGSATYWTEGGRAWGWLYLMGTQPAANYLSTWKMMQDSLVIKVSEIPVADAVAPLPVVPADAAQGN